MPCNMQTKLVYVLTCAPEATYIEQALLSIWSARYHNPDAHIVLMVDDQTNQLFVEKRAEVLKYISEKVVVTFENRNDTMMYRSRYIKTQIRKLVKGNVLFVDSDTIINGSLAEIDDLDCIVGAVCESNLPISQFCVPLYQLVRENAQKIGWKPMGEQYYFSSGVIYAKDTPATHQLFEKWHQNWRDGLEKGINIDQPSLAKANIECGHIVQRIDDKWNCIMFTYPRWAKEANILHFASYRNMSFLFSNRVLKYIRENGLTDYIKRYVINPTNSYVPFNCEFYHYQLKDYLRCYSVLYKGIRDYTEQIDATLADYVPKNSVYVLLRKRCFRLATILLLVLAYKRVHWNKSYKYTENICSN